MFTFLLLFVVPSVHTFRVHPSFRTVRSASAIFGRRKSSPRGSTPSVSPNSTPQESQKLLERGAWMPIGSAAGLRDLTPTRVEVAGKKLVVWRHEELWSVMPDACSHRLAPLSQGRVDPATGCVECPYHGWQFGADGTCEKIPQGSGIVPPPGTSLTSLPLRLTGDIIWAFFDEARPDTAIGETRPFHEFPETIYPRLLNTTDRTYVRELPYSFDFLIENFMDPAHIPFAHHSLQSVRSDGRPIPMSVLANNETHLEVSYLDVVRGKEREGVVSFARPCFYHFRTLDQITKESRMGLFMLTVPVAEGRSRLFITNNKPSSPSIVLKIFSILPVWLLHSLSNNFIDTDIWLHDAEMFGRTGGPLTESAEASVPTNKGLNYVLPTTSDLATKEWRKWWAKSGMASAPKGSFSAATAAGLAWQPRDVQLDRFENHVAHCGSCRAALAKAKKVRAFALIAALAIPTLGLRRMPALAGLTVALATAMVADNIAKTIGGSRSADELPVRSVAAAAV